MELIVRQGGKEREVVIETTSNGYVVSVDGRRHEIDLVTAGRTVRSLLMDGRQVEVGLHRRRRGHYEVVSFRGSELVEVLEPLTLLAEKAHAAEDAIGVSEVTADMPGRVVEWLVAEGDQVTAGQGVLVLEAMKMENEIQAERDGVVSKFFVAPGEAVEGGDSLYQLD